MSSLLHAQLAPRIAPVVLANITTPYPYHDSHLFREGDLPADPVAAHPAFGNSFDWHSSVHSHWTAVQLLAQRDLLGEKIARRLRTALEKNLSKDNLAAEAGYLKSQPAYERPYGWAWTLALAAACEGRHSIAPKPARLELRSLASQVSGASVRWLEAMPAPVRHGVHANTAFALGLMLDASRTLGLTELERAVNARANEWFAKDREYPQAWERSGYDFLSPGLAEADLMRRLLPQDEFSRWWHGFLPGVGATAAIFEPVEVPKVSDGQIAHLHGLNLSRAGATARIAGTLCAGSGRKEGANGPRRRLLGQAERLYRAGVGPATGDDYLATHWLATFAWDAASSIDAAHGVLA
jgi:hypothetical protein